MIIVLCDGDGPEDYLKGVRGQGSFTQTMGPAQCFACPLPSPPLPFPLLSSPLLAQNTSDLVVHQILVQVQGWKRITFPVSVDGVGVVFREVYPEDTPEDSLTGVRAGVTRVALDLGSIV